MLFEVGVGLAKVLAPEEAAVRGKAAGVGARENAVAVLVANDAPAFLRPAPPKHEHDVILARGHGLDDLLREGLPPALLVRASLVRPHRQHRVQKQNALGCPTLQVAVRGHARADVLLELGWASDEGGERGRG